VRDPNEEEFELELIFLGVVEGYDAFLSARSKLLRFYGLVKFLGLERDAGNPIWVLMSRQAS